jgi:hypothetical protein
MNLSARCTFHSIPFLVKILTGTGTYARRPGDERGEENSSNGDVR